MVTSIANISLLLKKENLGKRVVCYRPSPSLYRQHNANKSQKCSQGEFPKFLCDCQHSKATYCKGKGLRTYHSECEDKLRRSPPQIMMYEYHGIKVYQGICNFYRYFTESYNADFARVKGRFYPFHLPLHGPLAFTTPREAKACLKNDSAVKKILLS